MEKSTVVDSATGKSVPSEVRRPGRGIVPWKGPDPRGINGGGGMTGKSVQSEVRIGVDFAIGYGLGEVYSVGMYFLLSPVSPPLCDLILLFVRCGRAAACS